DGSGGFYVGGTRRDGPGVLLLSHQEAGRLSAPAGVAVKVPRSLAVSPHQPDGLEVLQEVMDSRPRQPDLLSYEPGVPVPLEKRAQDNQPYGGDGATRHGSDGRQILGVGA